MKFAFLFVLMVSVCQSAFAWGGGWFSPGAGVTEEELAASTNGIIEAAIVYADSVGGGDLQSVTAEGATTDIKITLTNDLVLVSNIVDTAGHKILAATDGAQAIYYDGGSVMFIDLGTSYQMKWQTGPTFMDLGTTFSMYDSAGNVFMDLGSGTEGLYFNNGLIALDLGITNHIATTNGIVLVDLKTGLITNATVALATGATVNEFSTDGTLAGNSDIAVPTEKAVRAYVDGVRTNIQTVLPGVFTITEAMHRWTFVAQTTSNVVYQLPSVDITTKALVYDFVNFQLAADTVAVRRADTDIFSDSTNGSFFASTAGETGATCRIYLADSNKWVFKALDGTWTPNYLGP